MVALQGQCSCGKVHLEANVCANNHLTARCYCTDCQQYAGTLDEVRIGHGVEPTTRFLDPEQFVSFVSIAKSNIKVTRGKELLQTIQLKRGSTFPPMLGLSFSIYRIYTSCCFTPVLSQIGPDWIPTIIVYTGLFQDKSAFDPLAICFSVPEKRLEEVKQQLPPQCHFPKDTGVWELARFHRFAMKSMFLGHGFPSPITIDHSDVLCWDAPGQTPKDQSAKLRAKL